MPDNSQRKVSVLLYLTALLISAIIFSAGIFLGKVLERGNLDSLSSTADSTILQTSSLKVLYLVGDAVEFCPVFLDELSIIDKETEELGYKLTYLEETKGITDLELKKKYFMLEANAYLLSQKVIGKCGASYSTVLFMYSNSNCTGCKEQGAELLAVKKQLGEKVRIYSFDGDIGSPIADAFKKKYGITVYPSIVINGNSTLSGFRSKDEILNIFG